MFIAFEGIDGSGKSTMSTKVAEYLTNKGKDILWTREPSEPYRSMIFDPSISDEEELLLFMADRARHINNVIKPAIDKGQIVITDRYLLSTLAYQIYAKNKIKDLNLAIDLHYWITKEFAQPDLTFVLSVNAEKALERATDKNKFEAKGLEYYKKIYDFYSAAPKIYSNIYLIDSSESLEKTFNSIISILEGYL